MSCCIPGCTAKTLLVRFPDHLLLRRRWLRVIELATGVGLGSDHDELKICLAHFAHPNERFYQEPCIFPGRRDKSKRINLACCKLCHRYLPAVGMCRLNGILDGVVLASILFQTIRFRFHPRDYTGMVCRNCLVKVDLIKNIQAEFAVHKLTTDMVDSLKKPLEVVAPAPVAEKDVESGEEDGEEEAEVIQVEYLEQWDQGEEEQAKEDQVTWEPETESDEWPEDPGPEAAAKPLKRRYIKRKIKQPKPTAPKLINQGVASSMKCYICSVQFQSRDELVSHLVENHRDPNEYVCAECGGKQFQTVTLFNTHLKYHDATERPFKCKFCPFRYCSRGSVRYHVARHHDGKPQKPLKPDRHRKEHQCETCGKVVFSIGALRLHMVSKHEGRRHQCPTCKKFVTNEKDLLKHKLRHLNERPFRCETCAATYRDNCSLKVHVAMVHEQRDAFKCRKCQTGFRTRTQYRHHMRHVHDHQVDYQRFRIRFRCALCNETPQGKRELEAHIAACHAGEPYPWVECPLCPGLRVLNGVALTWHNRSKHREGKKPPVKRRKKAVEDKTAEEQEDPTVEQND